MFRDEVSTEERIRLSSRIFALQPHLIPVIVDMVQYKNANRLEKQRFVVHQTLTISAFARVLRKYIQNVSAIDSIVLMTSANTIALPTIQISDLWARYHDPVDKFLYLQLMVESAFG